MLEKYYNHVEDLMLPAKEWKSFPTIDDRDAWEGLADVQKKYFLEQAEKYVGYDWPSIPAMRYMDYYFNGNRSRYSSLESKRREALISLVLGECIENKGRFVEDIINGIWVTLDEASWVGPAHNGFYPPIRNRLRPLPPTTNPDDIWVDHFAGDSGSVVAIIGHFIRPRIDAVAPQIYERLVYELNRRIIRPFMLHDDFPWSGNCPGESSFVNNWLPWVVSNCLNVISLVSDDAHLRCRAVEKTLRLLDRYMDTLYPDGGCEEGTRYWGVASAAVFGILEQLYTLTGGKIDVYDNEKLHNYTTFLVRNHISERRFTMYADADRNVYLNLQGAWYYAQKTNTPLLQQLAVYMRPDTYAPHLQGHSYMAFRELFTYRAFAEQPKVDAPLLQDGWFEGIQVVTARQQGGSTEGLFFTAHGGTNGESHNHNDVGTFALYSDGLPAVIDMGAGDYTASSFSDARYELNPHTNSAHHNLPMADGVMQDEGIQYTATDVVYENTGDKVRFGMNLEKAYPAQSPIASYRREYVFDRNARALTMDDAYEMKQPASLESVFITAEEPKFADGVMEIPVAGARSVLVQCPAGWTPEIKAWDLSGNTLFERDWNGKVWRTVFRPAGKVEKGEARFTFTQK